MREPKESIDCKNWDVTRSATNTDIMVSYISFCEESTIPTCIEVRSEKEAAFRSGKKKNTKRLSTDLARWEEELNQRVVKEWNSNSQPTTLHLYGKGLRLQSITNLDPPLPQSEHPAPGQQPKQVLLPL